MLEILLQFEQVAVRFSPVVLVCLGVVAVVFGLFIWLGGLGLRRLMTGIIGAVIGAVVGFFVIGRNIMAAILLASFAAIGAAIFEKLFIIILIAVLVAASSFFVLTGVCAEDSHQQPPAQDLLQYKAQNHTDIFNVRQTLQVTRAYIADFITEIKQIYPRMPMYSWALIAALVVIFILAGVYLWRLTSALCCSALGTIFIFVGLILLLLYKGAEPISTISRKQPYYAAVFIVMIAFGTIVQLLICRATVKKSLKATGAIRGKEAEATDEQQISWRTK